MASPSTTVVVLPEVPSGMELRRDQAIGALAASRGITLQEAANLIGQALSTVSVAVDKVLAEHPQSNERARSFRSAAIEAKVLPQTDEGTPDEAFV